MKAYRPTLVASSISTFVSVFGAFEPSELLQFLCDGISSHEIKVPVGLFIGEDSTVSGFTQCQPETNEILPHLIRLTHLTDLIDYTSGCCRCPNPMIAILPQLHQYKSLTAHYFTGEMSGEDIQVMMRSRNLAYKTGILMRGRENRPAVRVCAANNGGGLAQLIELGNIFRARQFCISQAGSLTVYQEA